MEKTSHQQKVRIAQALEQSEKIVAEFDRLISGGELQEVGGVAGARLQAIIDRIEKLQEEKEAIVLDIKEIYSEAGGAGFDVPTIRRIVRLRKIDQDKRMEQCELLSLYTRALGMQGVLPL